jgi:hypothetical protein
MKNGSEMARSDNIEYTMFESHFENSNVRHGMILDQIMITIEVKRCKMCKKQLLTWKYRFS